MVFDKHWFQKHQRALLWLANSWLGPLVFRFRHMGHHLEPGLPVSKITPCSVTQVLGSERIGDQIATSYREQFFSRNEYARKLYFALLPMWYAMHAWDWVVADHWRLAPKLSFGFSTLTQNPGSIGTDNPVDGFVKFINGGTPASWATIRGGAGDGSSVGPSVTQVVDVRAGSTTNNWSVILRSIFCFDTSSLTSPATISSAVLSLFGSAKSDTNSLSPKIDIFLATPAATNTLANADYTQIGSTSQTGAPITFAGYSISAYNDFTFNATGIGNISKTGISKFGVREAIYDAPNVTPTWASSEEMEFDCRFTDSGSNKPKLVVTYTTFSTLVRTASVTVSNAASRLATVARILTAKRALAVTVSRAASRAITVMSAKVWIRTASVSVSNAVGRVAVLLGIHGWNKAARPTDATYHQTSRSADATHHVVPRDSDSSWHKTNRPTL